MIRQPTDALLKALQVGSPLSSGISVVIFYLGLMVCPLLILALMLRQQAPPKAVGCSFAGSPWG
ncbi:hypothetical protein [Cyanobium sp. ATX-6F1]|uniref:hypothetical protein n=1 Tax=Cyanobium sp. ATX-6F1 TaxID=3137388 RepID=UPI0039BDCCBC